MLKEREMELGEEFSPLTPTNLKDSHHIHILTTESQPRRLLYSCCGHFAQYILVFFLPSAHPFTTTSTAFARTNPHSTHPKHNPHLSSFPSSKLSSWDLSVCYQSLSPWPSRQSMVIHPLSIARLSTSRHLTSSLWSKKSILSWSNSVGAFDLLQFLTSLNLSMTSSQACNTYLYSDRNVFLSVFLTSVYSGTLVSSTLTFSIICEANSLSNAQVWSL